MNKVEIDNNAVGIYNIERIYQVEKSDKVFIQCEGITELTIHNVNTGNIITVKI